MIEYDYPELFEEHESVHFIIVNSGATVSSVSHDAPSISDNEFLITENEMKQEAFSLTESLCSLQNLKFGLGESSHVSFTIYNSSDIPNLKDEEITIYLYFNNDSDTLFEVGTYIIEEDKYSADRAFRDINGYDVLHYLWDYDITEWYNDYFSTGPKAIGLCRANLFTWLNTQNIGYTINHAIRILPNDSYVIEKGIESDSITFGFFMQGIIEVQGRFLHCTRDGKIDYFKMEWYDKPAVNTYDEETTYPPVKYEDYTTWGIGFIRVYDKNNKRLFRVGSSDKQHPSYYNIVDGFVFANNEKRSGWKSNTKSMLETMHGDITHLRYKPCEFKAIGNLCYEVGDRIDYTWVTYDENDQPVTNSFYTYILERTFTGIQGFKDLISAKGDKKQPKLVKTTPNWHVGDSDESGSGDGTGGVSELDTEHDRLLIQKLRNVGIRMLDEPSDVTVVYNKQTHAVDISWTDPSNISDYEPHPVTWEGTVVVRKDDNAPIHRWDGTKIVKSTTRDQYSEEAYSDDTVEPNKKYYYAIMPYYTSLDDEDHPIRHYTWTKVLSVDTERVLTAPTIYPIQDTQISGTTITVAYTIPTLEDGTYTVKKLVVKKDGIPLDKTDGDVIIDLTPDPAMLINGVDVSGLDEHSTYYFVIFIEDEIGSSASSEPQSATTGVDAGWNFDYTGQIQEFTAPKTGIYQLETWGAQGGDATDGTLIARGGYGAYAVGEVFLTQGDTLYINIGGQNGYGGGGNGEIQYDIDDLLISTDVTNYASGGSGNMSSIKSLAEQYDGTDKVIYTYTKYSGSGDYSSPTMSYTDKKFNYSRGGGVVAGYTGFPIRGMSGMKSIEFDIVTTDTEDGSFVIALIDGNSHNVNLYSEEPNTASGGLKHIVVDSGLSDYIYTYFAIGISRTLTISNVRITYAT